MFVSTRRRAARRGGAIAIAIALLAEVVHAEHAPPALPDPLPLDWCQERAAVANPDLALQRALRDAAMERIPQASALDDPRFSYEASNLPSGTFDFDSTPMSGQQLWLRQALPFPGLRAKRERDARLESEAADFDTAERERWLASAVEVAFVELDFAREALAIAERTVDLMRELARAAESRYAVGKALQVDALRAQVAVTEAIDARISISEREQIAAARLAALLDLPTATSIPSLVREGARAPIPDLAPLIATADASSPRLRALASKVEAARVAAEASELEGLPDVDAGFGYTIRSRTPNDEVRGDDFLSAGLTIRLPVDRVRWRARAAERRALERAAAAHLRGAKAEVAASVRELHAALVRADDAVALLGNGLVAQAAASLHASRAAYQVGQVDLESVISSHERLYGAELRLARADADRRAALANLEAVVGESLR